MAVDVTQFIRVVGTGVAASAATLLALAAPSPAIAASEATLPTEPIQLVRARLVQTEQNAREVHAPLHLSPVGRGRDAAPGRSGGEGALATALLGLCAAAWFASRRPRPAEAS